MKHRQWDETMMRYFDRQLSDLETATLKQHMKHCARCQEQFSRLDYILGLLEHAEEIDPPEGFEQDVMLRINDYVALRQEQSRKSQMILAIMIMFVFSVPLIVLEMMASGLSPLRTITAIGSYIGNLYNIWSIGSVFVGSSNTFIAGLDILMIKIVVAIAIVFSSLTIASTARPSKHAVEVN